MDLAQAVEISSCAIALRKSRFHPHLARQVDGMWVLRDQGPIKTPRKSEVFVSDLAPDDLLHRLKTHDLGWHFLCACHGPQVDATEFREKLKRGGYRVSSTAWVYVHDYQELQDFEREDEVKHLATQEEINGIADHQWKPRKQDEDSCFYALADPVIFGMVESMKIGGDAYASDLYVRKEYRGQGYGAALKSALLKGDKARGLGSSVLVANREGRRLYPRLGYEEIGVMHVLTPIDRMPIKVWD